MHRPVRPIHEVVLLADDCRVEVSKALGLSVVLVGGMRESARAMEDCKWRQVHMALQVFGLEDLVVAIAAGFAPSSL